MVLESTQLDSPLAGRVLALASHFAQPPRLAPMTSLVHLQAQALLHCGL